MKNSSRQAIIDQIDGGLADIVGDAEAPVSGDVVIEEWRDWIKLITPFTLMADWHIQLWEWAWAIRPGVYAPAFVAIASRGGGKCLDGNTLIHLENGQSVPIRDIKIGDRVFCLNQTSMKIESAPVTMKWDSGQKPCIRIATRTRSVTLTPDHEVFTFSGWKRAGDVTLADRIASPRVTPIDESIIDDTHSDAEVKVLAYLIAEGSMTLHGCSFVNADPVIVDDMRQSCAAMGFGFTKRKAQYTYGVSGATAWRKAVGMWRVSAYTKRLPEFVYLLPERQRWIFLAAMIDTDGWVEVSRGRVAIALANEMLVDDLRRLFLTLGIITAKTRFKKNKRAGAWEIRVDQGCLGKLELPLILKGDKLSEAKETYRYSLIDTYPNSISKDISPSLQWEMTKAGYPNYWNGYRRTRNKIQRTLEAYEIPEWRALENADVFWDEVLKLENVDESVHTYDIEVGNHHNMISDGLVTHNSSQGEHVIAALGARCTRKYILYVRSSQELANASVSNIAAILENSDIRNFYPRAADRAMGRYGNQKAWTQRMLRCANGFSVVAFGLDTALRGTKIEDFRPDLICHEIGTQVYDAGLGRWVRNQDHPSFQAVFGGQSRREMGVEIETRLIPSYRETVTLDHKFWVWNPKTGDAGWKEAKDLIPQVEYIGTPIPTHIPMIPMFYTTPMSIRNSVLVRANHNELLERRAVAAMTGTEVEKLYPHMLDADMELWQILGYISSADQRGIDGDHIKIHFNAPSGARKKDIEYTDLADKFQAILERNGAVVERTYRERAATVILHHPLLNSVFASVIRLGTTEWIKHASDAQVENYLIGMSYRAITLKRNRGIDLEIGVESRDERHLFNLYCLLTRAGHMPIIARGDYDKGSCSYRMAFDTPKSQSRPIVKDGFIWNKIAHKGYTPGPREFIPIQTKDNQYVTKLGLSHNCLDDIDEKHDTERATKKKITTITETILPAGSADMTVLAIQNLIIPHGIFSQLAQGTADFLLDRIVSGPHPAVRGLEYKIENGIPVIVSGVATWEGQSLEICAAQMRTWGVRAFLREAQHNLDIGEGGIFDDIEYKRISLDDLPELDRVVCWIDPAVSSNRQSNCQAIQIDGIVRDGDDYKIYRLYSWEGIDSPTAVIKRALLRGTVFKTESIGIETNMGGILWKESYEKISAELIAEEAIRYIPEYKTTHMSRQGDKSERASQMLDDYLGGRIIHVTEYTQPLETAMRRFPGSPDDLVDASYHSWFDIKKDAKSKRRAIRVSADMIRRSDPGSAERHTVQSTERNAHSLGRRLGFRGRF